mmetsp:Transcript_43550/g.57653  ORF Transcript_43550/g.57653 Transcript_43550/m.57653 type:complete len:102 (+) Transcript_43550:369-674(+)
MKAVMSNSDAPVGKHLALKGDPVKYPGAFIEFRLTVMSKNAPVTESSSQKRAKNSLKGSRGGKRPLSARGRFAEVSALSEAMMFAQQNALSEDEHESSNFS